MGGMTTIAVPAADLPGATPPPASCRHCGPYWPAIADQGPAEGLCLMCLEHAVAATYHLLDLLDTASDLADRDNCLHWVEAVQIAGTDVAKRLGYPLNGAAT